MSVTEDYISALEKYHDLSKKVIEEHKKIIASDQEIIADQKMRITALEEIVCRLIEGRVSKKDKEKLLNKFRN